MTLERELRVLYFTRDYSPHDERFLTALARTGHEIFFTRLEPRQEVHLPGKIDEISLETADELHGQSPDAQVDGLKRLVKDLAPDIVHAGPLHGPAYIAALSGFPRLVSMSWGADILHDGEVDNDARKKIHYSLSHSAVFVCDCLAVEEKAIADYGFSSKQIYRFPWGVDLAHFSPSGRAVYREKLGWQDKFILLSNRSFESIYGVDVTLRAFISAAQCEPDLRLLLFGKGSQEELMRSMVDEAGIVDKVHFGGYVSRDKLPDSYRSADVFLSASHCDGSSVSLMEALACGLPALVSDIPGNVEWVHEGEQGWLFHDGDAKQMAEIICKARHDLTLEKLSTNARAQAEAHANWSQNFPVLLEAYEQTATTYPGNSASKAGGA